MFKLGDFAIDRLICGVAESSEGILYSLHQLADATIDITAESQDVTDKDGNLVRRIYKSKAGTMTANNAMLNVNILNASSGSDIERAATDKAIAMPKIITAKANTTVTLEDYVDGTIRVVGVYPNGANTAPLEQGDAATATAYSITEDGKVTLPSATGDDAPNTYLIKYERNSTDGIKLANRTDKFPTAVELTLKAIYIDPCDKENVKPCYVVIPSFQPTPETNVALQTDTKLEYKGDLQMDYCGDEKGLYYIYFPNENEEDAA